MEYRTIVYNAARDGKLGRLRVFLDQRSRDEVSMLIHSKTNGATPLIMAGRNGHLDVVKYLVEHCKAEIEQVGSVTFDGETIEGAPPLWCAAAAGHLNIVKYLVEHGANVNKTTFTNSTPLRAACFDGHFAIVKYLVEQKADIEIANRHGHTCLMISCYKKHLQIVEYLLKLKAQVNRKSIKGNTALHDCAESGSLEIMKLLLKHGAVMVKDHYQMTPLMAAAVAGFHQIVEYLISRAECSRLEKIEALELLGATYIDRKRDNLAALEVWHRALKLRFEDGQKPLPKPKNVKPVEAYEFAVEAHSSSMLDEIVSDPDEMRMQALLVRERILGPAHPDTSYYIRYRGALYADMGNFDRCISLWMYALEMQQSALEPVSPMTQSSFLSFAELFSFMTSEWRGKDLFSCLKFQNIMAVLQRAVEEVQRAIACGKTQKTVTGDAENRNLSNLKRLMVIVLHLLCLMTRLELLLSVDDKLDFRKIVYRLVRMAPLGIKRSTLLHLACTRDTTDVGRYPICKFPSLDVINLLIEVGADTNALDEDGNSPLHIAAKDMPLDRQVIKVLVESGSHIDACNNRGDTARELLQTVPLHSIVPPLKFMTLQCLASREIVKNRIPYKGVIGLELEKTVELHLCKFDTMKSKMEENLWPREHEK
ncbi:protein fem-1 C [Biomphalaria glabrata]|uniref:Protein fem-1 homolog C-like n=1 Tax=Biomphalaria glabrata TaxID=6526 RepID=A0A2C9JPZ7_BIOGL|nr:protein fem-1 homolog C-like [Biomphalaria glabrata]KAI8768379.1 protein fem-1-like protein C-like [Biomphalaria glabrata]KAI8777545.1 protein fem-1 C [Biomphalaria glabrata]